ncbi:ciliary microtubule inner protein 2C-like isoform X1 [Branchiostoma lanceolatum]|uniref:ciliary microtubule inner protein 2C-like isoform X1 n=1 Tax=Branchiostoma lanceolatum TaxID=7740 RepID=UPI003454A43B
MASRSAGTLITTHNATYTPPALMPGYKGHCPTIMFRYGDTYGNTTKKWFQDFRSVTLNNSQTQYSNGGSFPTSLANDPALVLGNRSRTRDRWLAAPRVRLYNVHHDGKEWYNNFDKVSQEHREYYKDKTGTSKRVTYFHLPTKAEDSFRKLPPIFYTTGGTRTTDIDLPAIKTVGSRKRAELDRFADKSSVRDRAMRDVFFERR